MKMQFNSQTKEYKSCDDAALAVQSGTSQTHPVKEYEGSLQNDTKYHSEHKLLTFRN